MVFQNSLPPNRKASVPLKPQNAIATIKRLDAELLILRLGRRSPVLFVTLESSPAFPPREQYSHCLGTSA